MTNFFYGVIEGFYGRQWSWQMRCDYAGFLSQHGFDCYIYAPKGDSYLRSQWRQPLPEQSFTQLSKLAQVYRQAGLRWGIGLSPLGLQEQYSDEDRRSLQGKVQQLNQLGPDILCILFDDARGDIDGLADRQVAISRDIINVSAAQQHIVCPSYYSFDPVLEQVFGKMPADYWSTLGTGLPESTGVFWTGNQVISEQYTEQDLQRATEKLRRRPILWDNYPVNDGKATSLHLHLQPYRGRPFQLKQWSQGHIVNPMNQPLLSRLVLSSLGLLYSMEQDYDIDTALEQSLQLLEDPRLVAQLRADMNQFDQRGLEGMSEEVKVHACEFYGSTDHPVAKEISDWLNGGYRFDPACLTG